MLDMVLHVVNDLRVSQECPVAEMPGGKWFVKVCRVIRGACILLLHDIKPNFHRSALN